jgi:hypothetical protein
MDFLYVLHMAFTICDVKYVYLRYMLFLVIFCVMAKTFRLSVAIINRENIVRFIKCQRIRWLRRVVKNAGHRNSKKDAVWKDICDKTQWKT